MAFGVVGTACEAVDVFAVGSVTFGFVVTETLVTSGLVLLGVTVFGLVLLGLTGLGVEVLIPVVFGVEEFGGIVVPDSG